MRYGSKNRIVRTLESFSVDKSSATCSLRCMEPTSDSRFDPNYALQMLLDAAQELSLEKLLKKFVTRAVGRPDVAFAQIWMVEKADGCLHLAVAGGSVPPQLSESADPIPVGTGILGQVAATGQRIARRIGDPDWKQLADPACSIESGSRRSSFYRSLSKMKSWESSPVFCATPCWRNHFLTGRCLEPTWALRWLMRVRSKKSRTKNPARTTERLPRGGSVGSPGVRRSYRSKQRIGPDHQPD